MAKHATSDQRELGSKPRLKVVNDRLAPVLAHGVPLVGAAATDFLFDGIKSRDALERFAGDRRGAGRGEFIEAAADMGPAEGELYVTTLSEDPVAAEPGNMEPGTFRLWTERNVLINMKNGRDFTATFRELTPNQFDFVDSENGAVTVFARAP